MNELLEHVKHHINYDTTEIDIEKVALMPLGAEKDNAITHYWLCCSNPISILQNTTSEHKSLLEYMLELELSDLDKLKINIMLSYLENNSEYIKKFMLSVKTITDVMIDTIINMFNTNYMHYNGAYYVHTSNMFANIFIFSPDIRDKCSHESYEKLLGFILALNWGDEQIKELIDFLYDLYKNNSYTELFKDQEENFKQCCEYKINSYGDKVLEILIKYFKSSLCFEALLRTYKKKLVQKYYQKLLDSDFTNEIYSKNLARSIILCHDLGYELDYDKRTLLHLYYGSDSLWTSKFIQFIDSMENKYPRHCLYMLLKQDYCLKSNKIKDMMRRLINKYNIKIRYDIFNKLNRDKYELLINRFGDCFEDINEKWIEKIITSNNSHSSQQIWITKLIKLANNNDIQNMIKSVPKDKFYYKKLVKEAKTRNIKIDK